eukprot:scaffold48764_cov68-Phaeocystis_antarctica.AAC.1
MQRTPAEVCPWVPRDVERCRYRSLRPRPRRQQREYMSQMELHGRRVVPTAAHAPAPGVVVRVRRTRVRTRPLTVAAGLRLVLLHRAGGGGCRDDVQNNHHNEDIACSAHRCWSNDATMLVELPSQTATMTTRSACGRQSGLRRYLLNLALLILMANGMTKQP